MKRQRNQLSRREFLKTTTALVSLGVATPLIVPRSALAAPGKVGANDKIIVGFIGVGRRARGLMESFPPGQSQIVAIHDVDRRSLQKTLDEKRGTLFEPGKEWNTYTDYRKMFESEKLDCVFIPTTDHGRTLPAMHACMVGLDVYAEKPLTTYIAEGRTLVNCVRKHNTVFQVGSQQRSMKINRYCNDFIRNGGLGNIKVVQLVNTPGPTLYTGLPEEEVPEGLDWNTWLGPTPERPYNRRLLGWMKWWDYSGGQTTNMGAHSMDEVQNALGMSLSGPCEIWPLENKGPNSMVAYKYANGVEVRLELKNTPDCGAIYRGTNGNLEVNRNLFRENPKGLLPNPPDADPTDGPLWVAPAHIANFFDCMRSREKPNADVEIGHRSVSVCHLINIARELNRKIVWNPEKEEFVDDPEANGKRTRNRRKGFELPEGY